jgi:hypothetical protein
MDDDPAAALHPTFNVIQKHDLNPVCQMWSLMLNRYDSAIR